MALDVDSYWKGSDPEDRRIKYASEYTPEIEQNAQETMRRINLIVDKYVEMTGKPAPTVFASGWRAAAVNEHTSNAAVGSKHLRALAGDVKDNQEGSFAWWCFNHREDVMALPEIDLYMEHPAATVINHPTPWCHLQIVPPGSKARAYFPDTKSAELWAKYDQQSVTQYA